MKLFNQLNFFDRSSLLLFSILPISIIVGNASININILLIDILFLVYCLKYKLWSWIKKDVFLYLIVLYIFLIVNSLYSYFILFENQVNHLLEDGGTLRSILFIKYILLIFAFSILLKKNNVLNIIHKSWLVIITIIILDIFFEKFFGKNIIGNISPDPSRIVSFFKDELVVGGLVFCFGYASTTYFINYQESNKSILPIILIFLLIPLSVFMTGEKSNFIKSILLFFVIIYFFQKYKRNVNYKILLISVIFLITCFYNFSDISNNKYREVIKRLPFFHDSQVQLRETISELTVPNSAYSNKDHPNHKIAVEEVLALREQKSSFLNSFTDLKYFAHYDVALLIFKKYPISGVGNKNFRLECHKDEYFRKNFLFSRARCVTHPHQIHFEILSEQGILGYFLILLFFLWFSIKNIKISLKNKNIYHFSNTAYLLIFFIPLLPGGGIFSTFNGSIFWIIFSLVNLDCEKN